MRASLVLDIGLVLAACAFIGWMLVRARAGLSRRTAAEADLLGPAVMRKWRREQDINLAMTGVQALMGMILLLAADWRIGVDMTIGAVGFAAIVVVATWLRLVFMARGLRRQIAERHKDGGG